MNRSPAIRMSTDRTESERRVARRCTLNQRGHALLTTTIIVALVAMAVANALRSTSNAVRISQHASDYVATEKAAEGAIEYAYGVWKERTLQQGDKLTVGESTLAARPSFPGMAYVPGSELQIYAMDPFGAPLSGANSKPSGVSVSLQDYPGWRGLAFGYLATAKLTSLKGLGKPPQAGAKRTFQYIQVPLFQSMYFFEHDLEIFFPAQMIVGGLVHSNSRLLLSGRVDNSLTFSGNVSHVGGYTSTQAPLGGPEWAGLSRKEAESQMKDPIYTQGYDAQVAKVDRYEPFGKKPAEVLNPNDNNPNNDSFRELIEPPVTSSPDPAEISKRRLYNKAGIVIEINGSTVNVTTKNGTTLSSQKVTDLKKAVYKPSTTTVNKTTMFDKRENKNVDVVNVNVAQVTSTLNNADTGFNGVIYIHDTTPTSSGDTDPRTVRLQNGGVLPDGGLTVVSENPVYIQGDYNTGTTTNPNAVPANATGNPNNTDSQVVPGYERKPSAVIADAVMFLSNNWKDANSSSTVSNRNATNSTYNTAIMAGFIPSGWDPDGSGPKAAYGYSGGANNFPRFLENWSNKSCTYYGSMVELFQSKTFTGKWTTGDIYSPPKRRWNYDTLFSSNPPPGGVDAVAFSRGAWMKF